MLHCKCIDLIFTVHLTSLLRCSLKVLEDDKELLCCKLGRLGSFGDSGSGDSSKYETELGTESSK